MHVLNLVTDSLQARPSCFLPLSCRNIVFSGSALPVERIFRATLTIRGLPKRAHSSPPRLGERLRLPWRQVCCGVRRFDATTRKID